MGFQGMGACRNSCSFGRRQGTSGGSGAAWVAVRDFCVVIRNFKCLWYGKKWFWLFPSIFPTARVQIAFYGGFGSPLPLLPARCCCVKEPEPASLIYAEGFMREGLTIRNLCIYVRMPRGIAYSLHAALYICSL